MTDPPFLGRISVAAEVGDLREREQMGCNVVCSAGAGEPKALIRGMGLSQDERGLTMQRD